jgi:hypothetical protein
MYSQAAPSCSSGSSVYAARVSGWIDRMNFARSGAPWAGATGQRHWLIRSAAYWLATSRCSESSSRHCVRVDSAAGLPELVCDTPEAFVARAVALAQDPALLKSYRDRLAISTRPICFSVMILYLSDSPVTAARRAAPACQARIASPTAPLRSSTPPRFT